MGRFLRGHAPARPTLVTYQGAAAGTHDLQAGPLALTAPGPYTLTFSRGCRVRVTGVAGGGRGARGDRDGRGGGAATLTGVTVAAVAGAFTARVGARGTGTDDQTTWCTDPTDTVIMQLGGGVTGAAGGRGGGRYEDGGQQ